MGISIRIGAAATAWLACVSCGNDAGLKGSSGIQSGPQAVPDPVEEEDAKPRTPKPRTEPDTAKNQYAQLRWFWQCESAPVPTPAPSGPDELVIEGTGPHEFAPEQLDGAPLVFEGNVCEPKALPRDIVFVVDTSGSMQQNDPRIGTSCGRLMAIDAVLASLPTGGQARIGLVTFNTDLDRNSTALFENGPTLYADLGAGGSVADVVCNANGGTNYDAGITKAEQLFSLAGRAEATKEIYFISDGQPNVGAEGILQAQRLKTVGVAVGADVIPVMIATIMLAGTDTVLENLIASRGPDGRPLHAFASQTGELTKALATLINNELEGAELAWRPIGTDDWQTTKLLEQLQGFSFVLPSINIDYSQAPQGLEVRYEFFDKHDNRYTTGGQLLWTAASSE